ncbi:MAG: ubiquinone/menaquinone biosynthesis C-methylase UbiE [Myxococcota bacterium]|jgi:ubiquinone/menaquinone biosynthesis C-methylase UbiE
MEEPHKYLAIASAELDIVSPVSSVRLDRLIDLLELPRGARVLDIGCGKGEMLIRICDRYGCTGVGIDQVPAFLASARSEAAGRVGRDRIEWLEMDVYDLEIEPETYDVVVMMDVRPFGDYREGLRKAWALVRSGGLVLLGERFWKGKPNYDLCNVMGVGEDYYLSHSENVSVAERESFTPLYIGAAARDEIDHYEGMQLLAIERFLRANPGDQNANAFRERARVWRDAYLNWGRKSLGFGLYLHLK